MQIQRPHQGFFELDEEVAAAETARLPPSPRAPVPKTDTLLLKVLRKLNISYTESSHSNMAFPPIKQLHRA